MVTLVTPEDGRFSEPSHTMLKRIQIQHLTLGMYLHEFCGSWMEHPFWRTKFVLKDPKDLARIQATAIQEIWIDTDKRPGCCRGHRIHVPRGGGCADRDRLQPPGRTAPGLVSCPADT